MPRRRLRNALELVSDIGALGFDLQHHHEDAIREAVKVLYTVNPEMFRWLSRVLREPEPSEPVGPRETAS